MNKVPINSIELAQSADFIRWVKNGCDASESHWYDLSNEEELNTEFQEAIQLVKTSLVKDEPYSVQQQDRLFSRIEDSIGNSTIEEKGSKIRYLYWISSAAAACLLALFIINSPSLEVLETAYAEQQSHILPEGSEVALNADTDLSFKKKRFAQSRILELKGEAFFEVKKGESFKVETEYGTVEVLGTSFNVYAREDRFEVSCHTGKVKVSNKENNSFVILSPGQESLLEKGKIKMIDRSYIDKEWISGIFHFENATLRSVANEMERQFDIKVKMESSLENKSYTGFFENKNLDDAFNSVLWPLRLELENTSETEYRIIVSKE